MTAVVPTVVDWSEARAAVRRRAGSLPRPQESQDRRAVRRRHNDPGRRHCLGQPRGASWCGPRVAVSPSPIWLRRFNVFQSAADVRRWLLTARALSPAPAADSVTFVVPGLSGVVKVS